MIGRLLLRLTVGGSFVGHGTQKLFGWFGGGGRTATATTFEQLGLRPGAQRAIAAGVAETGASALILAGLTTPLAASAITATMLTAIDRVHLKKGPWITNDGYEYNAVLIAAGLALADIGPGPISLDAALGDRLHGTRWAMAALITGATGAAVVELLARRLAAKSRLSDDSGDATPPAAAQPSTTAGEQQTLAA